MIQSNWKQPRYSPYTTDWATKSRRESPVVWRPLWDDSVLAGGAQVNAGKRFANLHNVWYKMKITGVMHV